jgi:hypothetical protein
MTGRSDTRDTPRMWTQVVETSTRSWRPSLQRSSPQDRDYLLDRTPSREHALLVHVAVEPVQRRSLFIVGLSLGAGPGGRRRGSPGDVPREGWGTKPLEDS